MVTCTKFGYENLEVWSDSMQMVKSIYRVIHSFPGVEQQGLSQQIKNAAIIKDKVGLHKKPF